MNRSQIPNLVTALRILLTIPVGWALLHERFELALILFAVAGVSDGVDGFLAKQFNWTSWIGGILDPLADKALLTVTFIVLAVLGLLPVWLVVFTIIRDLVILLGALYYHFRVEYLVAEPRLLSKLHTTLQILLALLVVFVAAYGFSVDWLVQFGVALVAMTTLASGVDYVRVWSKRAARRSARS
ncbi:MAG: CDP-alcohol phosphatidyltransferase family protein [Gammaproteobacteria bacterium]